MGSSGGEKGLIIDQIKNYYIFQKKLQSVLNNEQNSTLFNKKSKFKIEEVYLINHNWINSWKHYTNYDIAKDSLDKIVAKDENDLKRHIEKICHNLSENDLIPNKFIMLFKGNKNAYKQITGKKILEPEQFECIVDKKTFELMQDIGETFYYPSEKKYSIDIILSKRIIILLIKEKYIAKFLYYGNLEADFQLIQLTAKYFDKEGDGINSEEIYKAFINFLLDCDEDYLLGNFNENSIGFVKNIFIKMKEGYKIQIQNELLASKYFDQEKHTKNINFNNVNKFRKVGLANIGATCYMNATLECFINVDPLTRYLLTERNYNKIINDSRTYELSSAYCDLLASVICDENITNYYEPYNFKEIISWKNPIFEGINANDSKDLINFMLEEMNQELSKLNLKEDPIEILDKTNPKQINQNNPALTFNNFKNDFIKKNDSIISRTFFFIIESKSQCQCCKSIIYNYQSLFLLEFPLENVYRFFTSKNYNLTNNEGEKVINLYQCLEQYREPTFFIGDNQLYCNVCKRQTDNINSNVLYSLPPYLIIILNRGKGKSFDCKVDFPEFLDLENYVMCPYSIHKYQLSGVICHLGRSGMSGHFIAYCRQRIKNKWYCFNDATITLCQNQNSDYKKGSPYILFYEAIDRKPNVLFSDDIPFYDNNINNNQNNFENNNMINNNLNINNNNFANMNMNGFNNNNNFNNMNNQQNNINIMNMMNNNNIMINNSMNLMNNDINNRNNNNHINHSMNNNMMGMNNNNINNSMNNNMMNINNSMNNNMMNINNNINNAMNNNMMNINKSVNNSGNNNINNSMNNNMMNMNNNFNMINQSFNSMNNNNNGNQNIQMSNFGNNNTNMGVQNMNFQNNLNNNNNMMFNNMNNNFN